jgi:perosamine synthetase
VRRQKGVCGCAGGFRVKELPALLGGPQVRSTPFPPYPMIGQQEKEAILEVLKEGRLSTFIAAPGEHFLGGKRIRQFEEEFANYNGVKYAVAFNSATAALHAAIVAMGVQPGEEVITTPYTFTSSATCALMHNAIPVFADVDSATYCLDPDSIRTRISPLTRAIIPVHLFGHPAPLDEILAIAKDHDLKVIEDCAQAPGALYKGKKVGTFGDCGIFSFQETKNMMTGEGGMLITNDELVAEAARLVRNHGETVAETMTHRSYSSEILGWGYRMTEFEAALGRVQLRQLDGWNQRRRDMAERLSKAIDYIPGLRAPVTRKESTHVYYIYPLSFDQEAVGLPRGVFADALKAEGIPLGIGYVKPLYLSPLYQKRNAFAFKHYTGDAYYTPGLCPVAEDLHFNKLLVFAVLRPPAEDRDIDDIARAIHKVIDAKEQLLQSQEATITSTANTR